MSHDRVRWYVRTYACAAFYEHILAYVALFVDYDVRRKNRAFVDLHVAGNFHTVTKHTVTDYMAVMAYV